MINKYKFTIDFKLIPDIKVFFEKNPQLKINQIEFKKTIPTQMKFVTDDEESLFKFHKFLLKIHHIESNFSKKDIKEPKIPITLNGTSGYKAYFNYLLGSLFFQILAENSIEFSISKVTERYFHLWECISVWITEKELSKIKKIILKTPLSNYQVINPLRHIIADI